MSERTASDPTANDEAQSDVSAGGPEVADEETSDEDYWGSVHCFPDRDAATEDEPAQPEPEPTATRREAPRVTTQSVECLVVGHRAGGKSSWIGALERACCLPTQDSRDLRLFARGEAQRLGTAAVESISSYGDFRFEKSRQNRAFEFEAGVLHRGKPPQTWQAIKLLELPEEIFTAPFSKLKRSLRSFWRTKGGHRCLVLTLDANGDHLPFWQTHLSAFLENLRNLDNAGRSASYGFLQVDRVLILITKIDLPLLHLLQQDGPGNLNGNAASTSMRSAQELAARIDPVRQAYDLLGEPALELLRNKITPGKAIAAGTVSARGFDLLPSGDGNHPLKSWRPFGLSDVARFVAFGEIRGQLKQAAVTTRSRPTWRESVKDTPVYFTLSTKEI